MTLKELSELKTDECSRCGSILECELCRQGHGIGCQRTRIAEMIRCQFAHRDRMEGKNNG